MANLVPGTNSTLKSATYEAQIAELGELCWIWQQDTTKNPEQKEYITIEYLQSGTEIVVGYNFPLAGAETSTGFTFSASEYLENVSFSAGTGGTIDINNTLGYLWKLIYNAQQLEAALSTTSVNNIRGSYNIDTGKFSGSATIGLEKSIAADGSIVKTAQEFL